MTLTSVVLEDNTFTQACKIHCDKCPCTGAYFGQVSVTGQSNFKVNGKKVVLSGITHTYGCPDCSSNRVISLTSGALKVNGVYVALVGPVTGAHVNGSIAGTPCNLKA